MILEQSFILEFPQWLKHLTKNNCLCVCDNKGGFTALDIPTRKQVIGFNSKNTICCVVTYDNKFLIIAGHKMRLILTN